MDGNKTANSYIFGAFQLDTSRMLLQKGERLIPITRKRLGLLVLLLENAGNLLTKDEIIEQIWPDQDVDESNLANNIYALRQLIEEDSRNPQLIVTVPGRGYKFIGEVQIIGPNPPVAPEPPEVKENPRTRSRNLPWIAMGGVAILVSVGIYLASRSGFFQSASPGPIDFPIPLTALPGTERYPALSYDGRFIAFTWGGEQLQNQNIYVKQTIDGQPIRITSHPNTESYPTWSPDGRYIAFLRQDNEPSEPGHLLIIPALGGTERELGRVDGGLDWSPDGKYIVVTGLHAPEGGGGLNLISVEGQEHRRLSPKDNSEPSFDSSPRFSPDGRSIAFLRWKSDAECDIFVADVSSGEMKQISVSRRPIVADSLQWSVDGKRLYFISKRAGYLNLWQIDREGGEPTVVPNFTTPLTYYSIARRANMLAYVYEQRDTLIKVTNPAGASCQINSSLTDTTPRFSPDGSMIVFNSDRSGGDEIWLAKTDCSDLRQLTNFNEIGIGSPRWSPDGTRIAFDRRGNGTSDIYTIAINGTDLQKLTNTTGQTGTTGSNTMPSWSPDGSWIYFTSNRAAPYLKNQIWKVPATGGEAIRVTRNDGWEPISSSDGQTIFFNHYNRIWELNLATGEESSVAELAGIHVDRNWSVTSDSIFLIDKIAGGGRVMTRLDLRTRKVTTVSKVDGVIPEWNPALAVSSDNRQYAVCLVNIQLSDIMLIKGWR
jgi:Tol biopolymer transport system component/DNA-binding winged helix-turn-helix (wHTH) protein